MTPLDAIDHYWLSKRLEIATEEVRRLTPEMAIWELRLALADIPGSESMTVGYASNGNQIVTIGEKSVEVGPMASNEEIRLALLNPHIKTENTRVTMASPLQGIGQKLSLLKHNAELGANKIAARVDALAPRLDTAVNGAMGALDAQEKDLAEVETFVTEIEKATNQ